MARIIQNPARRVPTEPAWRTEVGEDFITLVLDKNEAVAVRNGLRDNHRRAVAIPDTHSTSINGAGARVFEAVEAATKGLL
jgi:hypothetical protein